MKVKINALSMTSVYDALFDLEKFRKKLDKLATELPKALAEIGAEIANVEYADGVYDVLFDGTFFAPSITVSTEPIENGWSIIANGQEVCFVEFGAGVSFAGTNPALSKRPPGVVGIGQYGDLGNRKLWGFGQDGKTYLTYGTPANNVLYYTSRDVRNRIEEEARRILNE